jgi:hypothetical protein
VDRIAESLNPAALSSAWGGLRPHLSEETLFALNAWSEMLPDEESEIEMTALMQLLADIEDIESTLPDANLPEELKIVIRQQLDGIRAAIRDYRIVGATGLRKAAEHAVVEIIKHQEEFKAHADSKQVSKFGYVVKAAGKLSTAVITAGKLAEAGRKVYDFIQFAKDTLTS